LVYKKKMKAKIHITLKSGVLDPQGKAIQSALGALGFDDVGNVRQGKFIELDIAADGETEARERLTAMCEQLLANTVIENYAIELEA